MFIMHRISKCGVFMKLRIIYQWKEMNYCYSQQHGWMTISKISDWKGYILYNPILANFKKTDKS